MFIEIPKSYTLLCKQVVVAFGSDIWVQWIKRLSRINHSRDYSELLMIVSKYSHTMFDGNCTKKQ